MSSPVPVTASPGNVKYNRCYYVLLSRFAGDLPETDRAAAESLALPIYPELTREAQHCVVEAIGDFFARIVPFRSRQGTQTLASHSRRAYINARERRVGSEWPTEQTVNLLAHAFAGSNPALPTFKPSDLGYRRRLLPPASARKISCRCSCGLFDFSLSIRFARGKPSAFRDSCRHAPLSIF